MAAEQKQIVKTFCLSRWSVDEQLRSYLNENPGLRVVSMAVMAYCPNDQLLVVLEPVAEEAEGCSAVLACPMVRP